MNDVLTPKTEKEIEDSLRNMKMFDKIEFIESGLYPDSFIKRMPGGWMYVYSSSHGVTSQFIPLTDDF